MAPRAAPDPSATAGKQTGVWQIFLGLVFDGSCCQQSDLYMSFFCAAKNINSKPTKKNVGKDAFPSQISHY